MGTREKLLKLSFGTVLVVLGVFGSSGLASADTIVCGPGGVPATCPAYTDDRGDYLARPGTDKEIRYGSFTVNANSQVHNAINFSAPAPCNNCYITDMVPKLVYDGDANNANRHRSQPQQRRDDAPLRAHQSRAPGCRLPQRTPRPARRTLLCGGQREHPHAPAATVWLLQPGRAEHLDADLPPREQVGRSEEARHPDPLPVPDRPAERERVEAAVARHRWLRRLRVLDSRPDADASEPDLLGHPLELDVDGERADGRDLRPPPRRGHHQRESMSQPLRRSRAVALRCLRRSSAEPNSYFGPVPPNNPPPADLTGTTLCRSEGYYGTPYAGTRWRGHLDTMSSCGIRTDIPAGPNPRPYPAGGAYPTAGVPFKVGDAIKLHSEYVNDTGSHPDRRDGNHDGLVRAAGPRLRAAEGRDADASLARARIPAVHGTEPHARPTARLAVVHPAGAVVELPHDGKPRCQRRCGQRVRIGEPARGGRQPGQYGRRRRPQVEGECRRRAQQDWPGRLHRPAQGHDQRPDNRS